MQNLITPRLLKTRFRDFSYFGESLAPYFVVQGRRPRKGSGPWLWNERTAAECLSSTWTLLGRWNARRGVKGGIDRELFDATVPGAIARLAGVLNSHSVGDMYAISQLATADYRAAVEAIQAAVMSVASVKKTQRMEPMFGSKVVHHYFPSVVPVFDTAMIRRGVMRSSSFRNEFLPTRRHRWVSFKDSTAAGGAAALEFHEYFAYCIAQIAEAPDRSLKDTRTALGTGLAPFAPAALVNDPESLLWRLDAKLAEFCALGQSVVEDHERRSTTRTLSAPFDFISLEAPLEILMEEEDGSERWYAATVSVIDERTGLVDATLDNGVEVEGAYTDFRKPATS